MNVNQYKDMRKRLRRIVENGRFTRKCLRKRLRWIVENGRFTRKCLRKRSRWIVENGRFTRKCLRKRLRVVYAPHHKSIMSEKKRTPRLCEICHNEYSCRQSLYNHKKTVHNIEFISDNFTSLPIDNFCFESVDLEMKKQDVHSSPKRKANFEELVDPSGSHKDQKKKDAKYFIESNIPFLMEKINKNPSSMKDEVATFMNFGREYGCDAIKEQANEILQGIISEINPKYEEHKKAKELLSSDDNKAGKLWLNSIDPSGASSGFLGWLFTSSSNGVTMEQLLSIKDDLTCKMKVIDFMITKMEHDRKIELLNQIKNYVKNDRLNSFTSLLK